MIRAFPGWGTVFIVSATATCGLLLLRSLAPASPDAAQTDAYVSVAADIGSPHLATASPPTSTPDGSSTSTTDPTTTIPPVASPVPRSVTTSTTLVGAGGIVEFAGVCQEQEALPVGPVIVWVIADTTERIDTGLTAPNWTYRWSAPTDPARFGSYAFQFWCGDPSGWQGGYPSTLQRTVDMVAQSGPPSITTAPALDADPLSEAIPETD